MIGDKKVPATTIPAQLCISWVNQQKSICDEKGEEQGER